MTTHMLPLTYKPKIQAVKEGRCRQTIRKRNLDPKRWRERGDKLILYTCKGPLYHSKWDWRGVYTIQDVLHIHLFVGPDEHECIADDGSVMPLTMEDLTDLARADFIEPVDGSDRQPDGRDLLLTLARLNKGSLTDSWWEVITWWEYGRY